MNGFKSIGIVTASFAVLAGGLGCTADKRNVPPPQETVSNVSVLVAKRAPMPDYLEAVGTVRSALTSQLASQIMGTITRINMREGDRVRRGQVLVVIDELQQRAGMDRARAGLAASEQDVAAADAEFSLAEATLKRYQSLYEKKSLSPQEYEEVKTRFAASQARRDAARAGRAQAEAGMAQARSSLDYTRITAPFDGVVTAKLAEVGAMATPGMPVLVVEDQRRFRLETTVDESAIAAVRLGQTVPVTLDALGAKEVQGKVVQLVPAADPGSRTFLVKIELPPSSEWRSGLFGRARFQRGERESILIPQTAVLDRGQMRGVYVVGDDQVADLRFVTLGRVAGGEYEVLSGLENGERVVMQPNGRELAGRKIEVR